MTAILAFVLVLPIFGTALILDGYCFMILWGWFVVPTFGLPALTIPQAVGLGIIGALVTHQFNGSINEGNRWQFVLGAFANPLIFLATGWLIKQWV